MVKHQVHIETEYTLPTENVEESGKGHPDTIQTLDLSDVNLKGDTKISDVAACAPTNSLSLNLCKGQEGSNSTPVAVAALVDSVPARAPRQLTTVHDAESSGVSLPGHTDTPPTIEDHTVVEEGDISIPATTALDVSVESGGSSDTITASIDSTQMIW